MIKYSSPLLLVYKTKNVVAFKMLPKIMYFVVFLGHNVGSLRTWTNQIVGLFYGIFCRKPPTI